MTEGLFLITTLFVAYVVYIIINEKKNDATAKKPSAVASTAPQTSTSTSTKEKPSSAAAPKVKAVAEKPAPTESAPAKVVAATTKTATAKPSASKAAKPATGKTAAPTTESLTPKGSGLKDPKTGEVTSTYSNYRFTKRWIKEALVTESLIDKVYKNDELNADVETKLKTAITKLEGMKKYQP